MTSEQLREESPEASAPTQDIDSSEAEGSTASTESETQPSDAAIPPEASVDSASGETAAPGATGEALGATIAEGVGASQAESQGSAALETPATTTSTPDTKITRKAIFLAGFRRVLNFTVAVVLLAGGVVLGQRMFDSSQTVAPTAVAPDPAVAPPAIVREFVDALKSNDADALRSSLSPQPHKDITDEFERYGIREIQSVETLKTDVDGKRSATEILMLAENSEGLPFGINLVILVDDGKIEGFR